MPVRLTNRFSADRDMGPARVDTNFEDIRRWGDEVDSTFSTLSDDLSSFQTDTLSELDSLSTFTNAIQSDLTAESLARESADTALAGDLTALDAALTGDIVALDTALSSDIALLDSALADAQDDILDIETVRSAAFIGAGGAVVTDSTYGALFITTEAYDPRGWHSGTSANITPDIAGYYTATVNVNAASTGAAVTRFIVIISKNGNLSGGNILGWQDIDGIGGHPRFSVHASDFAMNGTTDYIQVQVWQNSGGLKTVNIQNISLRLLDPV